MIELEFGKKSKYSGSIALGFFDCVHLGHVSLIEEAKKEGPSFCFTFRNDISSLLSKKDGYIYTYEERIERFKGEGLDGVIWANFDQDFMNMEPLVFLDNLYNTIRLKRIITGDDYTFGKMGRGTIKELRGFCDQNNIELITVPTYMFDGEVASTTLAKRYLKDGLIEKLNRLLKRPYRVTGVVELGHQNGRKISFPTANTILAAGQTRIKEGVYIGYVYIQNKKYKALINAGARPTLDDYAYKIESFLDGFEGNLYGEKIEIEFIAKVRDVMKFESLEELKKQIELDKGHLNKL